MKKTKGLPCEWMTEDVKETMDQRDKLLQKAETKQTKIHIGTNTEVFEISVTLCKRRQKPCFTKTC